MAPKYESEMALRARFLATVTNESSCQLKALPFTTRGILLDNFFRVAIGLSLGARLFQPLNCLSSFPVVVWLIWHKLSKVGKHKFSSQRHISPGTSFSGLSVTFGATRHNSH